MSRLITCMVLYLGICLTPIHTLHATSVLDCDKNPNSENCKQYNSGNEGDNSNAPSNSESTSDDAPSLVWNIIKLVLALAFIIFLIYALLKFVNKRNNLFNNVRTVQNLGGVSLGQNKSIQMVRIGKHVFAVGVGDNVELLTEITDEDTIQELSKSTEQEAFKPGALLSSVLPNLNKNSDSNESSSIQFQQLFNSELHSLKKKREQAINKHQQKKEDSDE